MLGIRRDKGTLDRFYMVKDLRSVNKNIGEDDKTLWEYLEINPFTLAEVENKADLDLISCGGIIERPALELKCLSVSKLEIVQTAERGDWSEGVPPVGLYPIDQDTEGG